MRSKIAPYLFIAPFFIMFIVFFIGPIFYGIWLSFNRVLLIGKRMDFVGIKNYTNLFTNPMFYRSLKVTILFTLGHGSTHLLMALGAALILNLKLKGRIFFRSVFFLPVITSLVVAALIWKLLLDSHLGLVNMVLGKLGLPGNYKWLDSPQLSLFSLIIISNWRYFGFQMVILLAGLQNIPLELYEAAKIDGANPFQVTLYITLPLLFPVIFFCMVIIGIGSFQLFAEPFILTQGGPAYSTLSVAMYLYQSAFQYFKIGYSAALGYVLSIIIMAVAFFQVKVLGRRASL